MKKNFYYDYVIILKCTYQTTVDVINKKLYFHN